MTPSQGLTLVHFPAQSKPFMPPKPMKSTQRMPQKMFTLSRKVVECKPLPRP